MRLALIRDVGQEKYDLWFRTLDVESYTAGLLTTSVPVTFIRDFVNIAYLDDLLRAARTVHPSVERVELALRVPWSERPRRLSFYQTIV